VEAHLPRDRFLAERSLSLQWDGRGMAHIFEQVPGLALRPFVKRFLVVNYPSFHRDEHLPDTCPVAAFSFEGRCRIDGAYLAPKAAFTGLRETSRRHEHSRGNRVLLATFTPVGAAAFLRPSLDEFGDTTTDLAGILACTDELNRLNEQVAEAERHAGRVKLLEDFLLARVRAPAPDPLVSAAVTWLEQRTAETRIAELTRHIGLSQSALERRFRRVVGVSPKKFASLVRLRRAVRLRTSGADFTSVAHAAGYFDQSHFINDFRRAAGRAPSEYFL
jgi:AraC-like DNA-binding protein